MASIVALLHRKAMWDPTIPSVMLASTPDPRRRRAASPGCGYGIFESLPLIRGIKIENIIETAGP